MPINGKCKYCSEKAAKILNLPGAKYALCQDCYNSHIENNQKAVELGKSVIIKTRKVKYQEMIEKSSFKYLAGK